VPRGWPVAPAPQATRSARRASTGRAFPVACARSICEGRRRMRSLQKTVVALMAALALTACPDKDKQPEEPQSPKVEAPPPAPPELEFLITAELNDGSSRPVPTETPEPPLLPPVAGLSLSSNMALENHRIRVFDEA